MDVALLVGTVVPEAAEVTLDDGIDYLIADLAGDPLWQNSPPSIDPDLYVLTGFDHHRPDTVRVYLAHDNHTIGIDLAVRDDTGTPPAPSAGGPPPNSSPSSGRRSPPPWQRTASRTRGTHCATPSTTWWA
ncbi:hypothetical protein ACFY7H_32975 [Streptomyces sp. NPDC012794]|uniref:hypothetical protein n=1 Tax=Streptomyces sp. NPDC012794 TaxID=3364850 RepID=UPI0036B15CDD